MTVEFAALKSRFGYLVPLNKLPADRQSRLLAQAEVVELRKKDILFRQGDRDDFTCYVLEGELELFADDSLIKRVSGGEGASFQPLAQLQPRQMTAVAKTKATVLRLRRSLVEQLLSMDQAEDAAPALGVEVEEVEVEHGGDWLMTLLQSELFTRIPPSNIQGLLDTLEPITAAAGEEIVRQGDPGDYYYALRSGTCEVVRRGANKREIRLAELGPGDTFGEEALISGARRNATVRMTSDGELARLTKDDFSRLVKAPLLHVVDRAEAEALVKRGARWLDVRFEDEHRHNGLPDSLNIPLGVLRTRAAELDPAGRYIAYCDTGGRSSAAAFLLAERGFEVCYVEGGAVGEPLQAPATAEPPPPGPTIKVVAPPPDLSPPQPAQGVLEAAAHASAVGAEVARADLTIAQAQKLMAEAQAMKADAERFVADKLERERARLAEEFAELARKQAEAEGLRDALAAREQAAQVGTARLLAELTAREEAARTSLAREQAEAAAREQVRLAELERRQAEAAAREQAARAELAHHEAEVAAREQARLAELERRQAEVDARAEALQSELARQQAEITAREKAVRTELETRLAQAAAQEQTLREALERGRAELAAQAADVEAALARRQAEVAEREAAARAALEQESAATAARLERLEAELAAKARAQQDQAAREGEALAARLAEADRLRVELDAQRAEAARAEAARQRLAEERERIQHEAVLLKHKQAEVEQLRATLERQQRATEIERATQERLDQQQARIEQESATLARRVAEAENLKAALLAQQAQAEAEVARQQAEVERRLEELETSAAARLAEEERRLAALYEQQAARLESLQAGREAELRESLRRELTAERGKFEAAVARATAELERAREERAAAIAAKDATAVEAQRFVDEYQRRQQALVAEQQALFARERDKLRAEAERIETLKAEAIRVRKEAEALKAAAELELAEARQRRESETRGAERRALDETISRIERRASAAGRELEQAIVAETAIVTAAEEHEDELERTYTTAAEINQRLNRELEDWIGEQEALEHSRVQRDILARQKEMLERIRSRAAAAKAEQQAHNESLLAEVSQQLAKG